MRMTIREGKLANAALKLSEKFENISVTVSVKDGAGVYVKHPTHPKALIELTEADYLAQMEELRVNIAVIDFNKVASKLVGDANTVVSTMGKVLTDKEKSEIYTDYNIFVMHSPESETEDNETRWNNEFFRLTVEKAVNNHMIIKGV